MFKRHPVLLWSGVGATALWFALVVSYAVVGGLGWPSTFADLGDFAAAIATPPVLFWVVLGYLLQAEELHLQYEELKEQVAATKELAQSARDQIEMRASEAAPLLEFSGCNVERGQSDKTRQWIQFRNAGGQASNFRVSSNIPLARQRSIGVHSFPLDVIDATLDFPHRFAIDFEPTLQTQRIELTFSFVDVLGTSYHSVYWVELGSAGKPRRLHHYRETAAEFSARMEDEEAMQRSEEQS